MGRRNRGKSWRASRARKLVLSASKNVGRAQRGSMIRSKVGGRQAGQRGQAGRVPPLPPTPPCGAIWQGGWPGWPEVHTLALGRLVEKGLWRSDALWGRDFGARTPCWEGTSALGRLVGKGIWRWDALWGRAMSLALGRLVAKGLWRWDAF